jgi:hypothetical protein
MKFGKLAVGLAMVALLSGCDDIVHRELRDFEVVAIKEPKYMQVDLRDVKTGALYKGVTVSTYCTGHENLQLHSVWPLIEATYQGEGGRYKRIYNADVIRDMTC